LPENKCRRTADANQETRMEQEKLNPQKPGITQPRDPKERKGQATQQQPRQPDDKDKSRQVPIEGE
jgi:hypothetical protein